VTVLFGGAFDPIHEAHLTIAQEVRRRFDFGNITFVPSGNPPHKSLDAPFEDRLEMARLACEPAGFSVSDCERGRPRGYTYDTLQDFPKPRTFIIGADAFADIENWHRWRDVLRMTSWIVVTRPGHEYSVPDGASVLRLDGVALDVSSSDIRVALARGERPVGLPDSVYEYIAARGLYGSLATIKG